MTTDRQFPDLPDESEQVQREMVLAWLAVSGVDPATVGSVRLDRIAREYDVDTHAWVGRRPDDDRGRRPVRRLWARVDERLVAPGPGFRVAEIQILLAAVIALRLATRDWTQIAERPAALRDGLTVMSWYTGTPPPGALVAVQVVGLACACWSSRSDGRTWRSSGCGSPTRR